MAASVAKGATRSHQVVGSWVIVDKATGHAIFETFNRATADKINTAKYDVVPIGVYLGNLNKRIRERKDR